MDISPPFPGNPLPDRPTVPIHPVHSNALSKAMTDQVADRIAERIAEGLVERVTADVVAELNNRFTDPQDTTGPVRAPRRKKERCLRMQRIVTRVLCAGFGVNKIEEIGLPNQPGPDIVDGDNEPRWVIDWAAGPKGTANREIIARWAKEVLANKDTIALKDAGHITGDQYTEQYIEKLIAHSFDAVRKAIKLHGDESGECFKRIQASKKKSKERERQKMLCSQRAKAASTRKWNSRPIPEDFFKPEYHSDSDTNTTPDLSKYSKIINRSVYETWRNNATYEIFTPGWRSDNITRLFHWLDKEYRHDTGNRPQNTRFSHPGHRLYDDDEIPDNMPRCMIDDEIFHDRMDHAKRILVLPSPAGWEVGEELVAGDRPEPVESGGEPTVESG